MTTKKRCTVTSYRFTVQRFFDSLKFHLNVLHSLSAPCVDAVQVSV